MRTEGLFWQFDGQGEWEAKSSNLCSDDELFTYRIQVCDDGSFDISKSDPELEVRKLCGQTGYESLRMAKMACQMRDTELANLKAQESS